MTEISQSQIEQAIQTTCRTVLRNEYYFSDLDGRPFRKDELYFERRAGAPLPDVVCRPADGIQLRTRFHEAGGNSIEHEVLVQPTARR